MEPDEIKARIAEALAAGRDLAAYNRTAAIKIQACADLVAELDEHDLADELRCLVADLRLQADTIDGFSDKS
jgi:hypothetical protein